jgi:uncharacterized RDD family membrane protein YckC
MRARADNPESSFVQGGPLLFAGFWVRVFAGIIDFIILLIPFSVVVSFTAVGTDVWYNFFFGHHPGQPVPKDLADQGPTIVSIGVFALIVFGWLYFALLESSEWRGTVGKHVLGLYVGGEQGERIGFWRASQRFAGGRLLMHVPVVGIYYFLLDCLCIFVVPPNRAIHDVLGRCMVLREPLPVQR